MSSLSGRSLCLWALLLLLGAAVPVAGQSKSPDLTLAYQFQRFPGGGDVSSNVPGGFNVDVSYPIQGDLRVVGQFDWSRKTESQSALGVTAEATATNSVFGGGVRWGSHVSMDYTPYVHVLVGAARSSGSVSVGSRELFSGSDTDAIVQVGGGVTVPINKKVSAVGQFDYRRIFTSDEGTNSIRVVGGIRVILMN